MILIEQVVTKMFYELLNFNSAYSSTIADYSKTKTSWHLWAEHEVSSTLPNFHLRAVFFVMESIIAYNLESKSIEYVL